MKDIGGNVKYVQDNSLVEGYDYKFEVENCPIDSLNGGSIYYDNINKHNENISISYRNAIGDDRNTIYENLKTVIHIWFIFHHSIR